MISNKSPKFNIVVYCIRSYHFDFPVIFVFFLETVSSWKLPIPTVVMDNAANAKKALELLELGWCGCYGHMIKLIVKYSLDFPDVCKILAKCRRLVGYFYRSSSLNDCLMEKQMSVFSHEDRYIGHRLIADVPTRWNSSLDMLERILEQMPAIMLLQAIQSSANLLQITLILHVYLLKSNQ